MRQAGFARKTAAPILALSCMIAFASCRKPDPIKPEQERWIEVMEENYPDDDFTYIGHGRELLGQIDEYIIEVSSARFPDRNIFISENNGTVVSNYSDIYHEEAIVTYYEDRLEEYMDFDEAEVRYGLPSTRDVTYMSHEDYIALYEPSDYYVSLYYDEGRGLQEKDEIIDDILRYLGSVNAYQGAFNFYRTGDDHRSFRIEILYTGDGLLRDLSYYEGEEHERDRIVNMQPLSEVTEERGLTDAEAS